MNVTTTRKLDRGPKESQRAFAARAETVSVNMLEKARTEFPDTHPRTVVHFAADWSTATVVCEVQA